MSDPDLPRRPDLAGGLLDGCQPCDEDVNALIARAAAHDLGVRFLQHGAQDAVAATFGVHAFVVDAARKRLATPGR